MTLSSASVPAVETAALASDAPLFMATHVGEHENVGSRIRINTSGTLSDPDTSHAGYPAHYAIDRSGLRAARPASAAATTYYGLRCAFGGGVEFDSILIEHDNLDTANLTITLQRSDVLAFTSPTTILTFGAINPLRHFQALSTRITGTGYLRLGITIGTGTFTPSIRELWIGRRRQMVSSPQTPVDYAARRSSRASSGTISRDGVVLHTRRGAVDLAFRARDRESTLRDRDTIAAVWSESEGGRWPVVFVPRPSSAPHEAQIMRIQAPAFDLSRDTFGERSFSISMAEQAPFLRAE